MKSSAVSEGSGVCARAGGTGAEAPMPCPAPGKCFGAEEQRRHRKEGEETGEPGMSGNALPAWSWAVLLKGLSVEREESSGAGMVCRGCLGISARSGFSSLLFFLWQSSGLQGRMWNPWSDAWQLRPS